MEAGSDFLINLNEGDETDKIAELIVKIKKILQKEDKLQFSMKQFIHIMFYNFL